MAHGAFGGTVGVTIQNRRNLDRGLLIAPYHQECQVVDTNFPLSYIFKTTTASSTFVVFNLLWDFIAREKTTDTGIALVLHSE